MLRQLQQYAKSHRVVVDALQRQAAEVVLHVFIALRRIGVEVCHDNNLLAHFTFMGGDHRTAGGVMPVLALIAVGIDIAGIEASHVALIPHQGELLAQIVS